MEETIEDQAPFECVCGFTAGTSFAWEKHLALRNTPYSSVKHIRVIRAAGGRFTWRWLDPGCFFLELLLDLYPSCPEVNRVCVCVFVQPREYVSKIIVEVFGHTKSKVFA
jgi:hypothetical protein